MILRLRPCFLVVLTDREGSRWWLVTIDMSQEEVKRRVNDAHSPRVLVVVENGRDDAFPTLQLGKIMEQIAHVAWSNIFFSMVVLFDLCLKLFSAYSIHDLIEWKFEPSFNGVVRQVERY